VKRDEGREVVELPRPLAVASAFSWRLLVVVAAAAVVVYVLVTLRLIVIPVFVALLLSTLLVPVADRLARLGAPRLLATWLTIAGSIGIVGGIAYLVAPQIVDQFDAVGRDVRRGAEDAVTWLVEGPLDLSRADVQRYVDQIGQQFSERRSSLISGAFRGAYLLVEIVVGILLTLVVTFFFVKDGRQFVDAILGLFRDDHRTVFGRSPSDPGMLSARTYVGPRSSRSWMPLR